ncbi:MAG TPA: universal stress protein [Thermoanaerobaculia bacterium]|nr:universal stress protein [Thermoanaerobaculia bacterium]
MPAITRILVPVDLGALSARTIEYAKMIAGRFDASLIVMHVVPNPYLAAAYTPLPEDFLVDLRKDAESRVEDFVRKSDCSQFQVHVVVCVGDPPAEIVQHARTKSADLIVIGAHSRRGAVRFFLGSVTEHVIRSAPCPVLTIR